MESAASAQPFVYMPIPQPHSASPAYAVLQFVNVVPPPVPSHSIVLPPHVGASSIQAPPCDSAALSVSSPGPKNAHVSSSASSDSSSCSGGKNLTSVKPLLMKKAGSRGVALAASCLGTSSHRGRKGIPHLPTVSVTYTDKDTIIHTSSVNFREVVHKLTGAGSSEKELMPVRSGSRSTSVTIHSENYSETDYNVAGAPQYLSPLAGIQSSCDKVEAVHLRKTTVVATTKLLQRRKSNKALEKLCTSDRNKPTLVSSPVTPLASDFDKMNLPVTPTTEILPHDARSMDISSGSPAFRPEESKAALTQTRSSNLIPMNSHTDSPAFLPDESKLPFSQTYSADLVPMESYTLTSQDIIAIETPNLPTKSAPREERLRAVMDAPVLPPALGNIIAIETPNLPTKSAPREERLRAVMDAPVLPPALGTETVDLALSDTANKKKNSEVSDMICTESCFAGISMKSILKGEEDESHFSIEQSLITNNNFVLYIQGAQRRDPTLLPLFPECPRES
ncbi:hypothetical protein KP509_1Z108800 [Ceratopteris richardii]|nr:hypothetical protein KP509_1Z108800 [Ceratopteris richardii]